MINIWSCIYKKQWKNNWHNRLLWWLQMLCLKPCNVIISAAAYSLGANFIWFIGLILSLLIIIGVVVFIIMCRRVTKHKPPPQSKLNGKSVWQLGKGGGGVMKYAGSRDYLVHFWNCQFDMKCFVKDNPLYKILKSFEIFYFYITLILRFYVNFVF